MCSLQVFPSFDENMAHALSRQTNWHTHTHTQFAHALHIFASEPLEHPGGTKEAKQGIRRRGIAGDLCVFAMAERAECGCALTERKKKIHAQMDFQGWGGCKRGQNHISLSNVKDRWQRDSWLYSCHGCFSQVPLRWYMVTSVASGKVCHKASDQIIFIF